MNIPKPNYNNDYLHNALKIKIIRNDVTCSFCVNHHISVCPNMSISFINLKANNFFSPFDLPLDVW
jgi:hypothetical protein